MKTGDVDNLGTKEKEMYNKLVIYDDGKIEYIEYDGNKRKVKEYEVNAKDALRFIKDRGYSFVPGEPLIKDFVMYLRETGRIDKDICPYFIEYVDRETGMIYVEDSEFSEKYKESVNIYKDVYGKSSVMFYKPGLTESGRLLEMLFRDLSLAPVDDETLKNIQKDLFDLEFGYVDGYKSPLKIEGYRISLGTVLSGYPLRELSLYIKPKNRKKSTVIDLHKNLGIADDHFIIDTEDENDIIVTAEFLRNIDFLVGYVYGTLKKHGVYEAFKKHGIEKGLPERSFI